MRIVTGLETVKEQVKENDYQVSHIQDGIDYIELLEQKIIKVENIANEWNVNEYAIVMRKIKQALEEE